MHAFWVFQKSIWALNLLGSALVVWRLYSLKLHTTYRYFFAGMALAVIRSSALFPFSPTDKVYYYPIWSWTQPLLWLSYALIVTELFHLVLREYRGIYSLGRWFFFGATAVAVVISGLTVLPTIPTSSTAGGRPLLLYYYAFIDRGLTTSLAIFLLLLLVLIAWFPVPLNRNLKIHCTVYSAYFFANNVIFLYWHVGTSIRATYISTVAKLFVAVLCYGCWAFYLTRAGEDRTPSLRLSPDALREKGLLGQLENLNSTLLGVARK